MKLYENSVFGEERALYGISDAEVRHCAFKGDEDGESALKECSNLKITDCDFHLRYPMWHIKTATLEKSRLYDTCRAPIWYCENMDIADTEIGGIKALRECDNVKITGCGINSEELGWFCRGVEISRCKIESKYPFLKTAELSLENTELSGKYSFQYVENARISHCILDTKDAFWHSKNVTVTDSTVKGEYLGWYSEGLTLVRCKIEGTQPLCYCKGLTLVDCEMLGCDLSFERSDVKAEVRGYIDSVKNPVSGFVKADKIGDVILDIPSECKITQEQQG